MEPVEAALELVHLGRVRIVKVSPTGTVTLDLGNSVALTFELTEAYKDYLKQSLTVDLYLKARNENAQSTASNPSLGQVPRT